ncbi:hypothetical protein FRC06_002324 [Ceratobasidium sp. 370]|nr:hypothetical protein FRC06_002324 [Ceratobasidium sp. 370]
MNHTTLSWQTLPMDLLVLILEPLVLRPRTSYIPFIVTHVCRHWRQAVSSSPSLWSYVDVSRGNALTELWLSNSARGPIDVKLWQPPEDPHTEHGLSRRIEAATENTKQHIERWRSLDISFWCGICMEETMAFLGCLEQNLKLDYLTVGPMGKTVFFPRLELDSEHPGPFGALKIEPAVLRVDSYRFAAGCAVFSTRLTTIEMFSAPDVETPLTVELWGDILVSTPNLMSLTLWHQTSREIFLNSVSEQIYVGEDLAMVRGPGLQLTDSSDSGSDSDEENGPDNQGDPSEGSDADGSSVLSWGTDASLASGDLYVIGQLQ